ncbi:MAG: hypothetical protein H6945_03975 [Zoogloeaceae bacterium]|nr:hypothetical protein [Zoogloeaceae bacterium]
MYRFDGRGRNVHRVPVAAHHQSDASAGVVFFAERHCVHDPKGMLMQAPVSEGEVEQEQADQVAASRQCGEQRGHQRQR